MTTRDSTLKRRGRFVFQFLGLSCIGGAILLQAIIFSSILLRGYFRGVENNPIILTFEIVLTALGLFYFIYMYQGFIRSFKKALINS